MASLDSYIKERNERINNGSLVYRSSTSYKMSAAQLLANRNNYTYKQNNYAYPDRLYK